MYQLIIEAIVVGIVMMVIGNIVGYFVGKQFATDLPPVCKDWNKNYLMEICLFLTGFIGHLLFELIGANKWYCKNGYACKR
jgi:ABC-type antimicrobial peptide transport system permease subunit